MSTEHKRHPPPRTFKPLGEFCLGPVPGVRYSDPVPAAKVVRFKCHFCGLLADAPSTVGHLFCPRCSHKSAGHHDITVAHPHGTGMLCVGEVVDSTDSETG